MPKYTLTILDTTGIQNYIFGSNRLKENVGASELVKRATEGWVYEALPTPNNMMPNDKAWAFDDSQHIEGGSLQAEVIYAGGGNAVILFDTLTRAKAFATAISKKLMAFAPGINFTVVHTEFEWVTDALGGKKKGVVFNTFANLADAKRRQPASRPLGGVSVSAFCQSTGLPAVDVDEDGHPISAETKAKLTAYDNFAPKSLSVPGIADWYKMEINFNELGGKEREGKGSYIAVVHADGNGMGKRVEHIAKDFPLPGDGNRAYITAIRKFSQDMGRATAVAVQKMEEQLVIAVPGHYQDILNGDKLPYRRIIVGGDDVTFVCDGRLSLTLTAAFLDAFEAEMTATDNENLQDVHAAAGIAVVKTHYPFIRAYELAEALTGKAKRWIKDEKEKGQPDFSAMDWHFAPGGLAGDLDFIRKREYRLREHQTLLMRPIALRSDPSWRNWDNFSHIVKEFTTKGENGWGDKRNKVKAFREALRGGTAIVTQFRTAYKIEKLPEIKTGNPDANVRTTGWGDDHCAYFDAIEAMDFYLPLNKQGDHND